MGILLQNAAKQKKRGRRIESFESPTQLPKAEFPLLSRIPHSPWTSTALIC